MEKLSSNFEDYYSREIARKTYSHFANDY